MASRRSRPWPSRNARRSHVVFFVAAPPLPSNGHVNGPPKGMAEKVNKAMAIYQLVVKGLFDGSSALRNIHHYDSGPTALTTTEENEVITNLNTVYKSYLQSRFDEAVTIVGYSIRRVDEANLPTRDIATPGGNWNGTSGGSSLPPQTCGLVTWKAATAFPRTTRTYLFPFGTSELATDGSVTSGCRTAMGSWGSDMVELNYTGGNVDKVAVKYAGTPRVVVEHNDVTTVVVSNQFATQRRRRPGVGA